jgi:alpha-L-fucosidase 2
MIRFEAKFPSTAMGVLLLKRRAFMSTSRRTFLKGALALTALPHMEDMLLSKMTQMPRNMLWYARAAERWLEAMPVGNGRMGGMVFGGVRTERIALSESTAWSGRANDTDVNPEALPHLKDIRQLLFAGNYGRARDLCGKYLLGKPASFGTNLPLPELKLVFDGADEATHYSRSLSLEDAVARVDFRQGSVAHSREIIASHPDDVLAIHLTSDGARKVNFSAGFDAISIPCTVHSDEQNMLILGGHAYERMHSNGQDGVALVICVQVLNERGSVAIEGKSLHVRGADSATVLVAIATSFRNTDPETTCKKTLQNAASKTFAGLKQAHIADYQGLYRRVSLDLGSSTAEAASLPTDERRKALDTGTKDPELLALFFQYGRYLTIAGSRADSPLPLALQGIWNDGLASSMVWTDDFHLDINTEQNYWAAEVCNLGECQGPLFDLIDTLRTSERKTATQMYGAPGWVCHTVTNPWGYTAPGWGLGWGIFVTAGIWIALQMWDHYTFNPDLNFLCARAYPVLREAAEFFLAYMVPEPTHGWLVTGPSDSPENSFIAPSGEQCSESMGNTCDREFVYALYSMCIESSKKLGVDEDLRLQWEAARSKLPPFQIGSYGQLQEWLEDFKEAQPNHRHTSHLCALYPLNQISLQATPELARAAEVTIERRLNSPHWEQTEWGRANLVVYYARLWNGETAHKHLLGLIAKAADDNLLTYSSAGVAGATQNIFALDGNTAGAAGIAEMLLQSQGNELHLLPAVPIAWPTESFTGLCARGGYRVDVAWRDGRLVSATIYSRIGGNIPVRYRGEITEIHLLPGQSAHLRAGSFASVDINNANRSALSRIQV